MREARADAIEALTQALAVASPGRIMNESVKLSGERLRIDSLKLDLNQFERILVIGGGKATAFMALELEKILGSRITAGGVNVPEYLKPWPKTRYIALHAATHPIPTRKGVLGVEKMLALVRKPGRRDLVICLISGGGSALMPMPLEGLELADEQQVTDLLLKSGADIYEINTVRKHLSGIKGGRLAERLFPARVVSLIISDVVGDSLEAIASGPTVPDKTTYADTKRILVKYGLWKKVSKRVSAAVARGISGSLSETPKPGSRVFSRTSNVLLATNKRSCVAAAQYLRKAGYRSMILSTHVQGEAKEVAKVYSAILRDVRANSFPFSPPVAIVAGGETTVTVTNGGRGGRNQELALASAIGIEGLKDSVVASMGTDGVDGPTDAAGAIVDGETVLRARSLGLEARSFLESHDSYNFFKRLGDLIVSGPTGTNVNDITLIVSR